MRWSTVLRVLLVVPMMLGVMPASSLAFAQTASEPTVAFKTERPLTGSSGEFDLYQGVLDIPAGGVVNGHSHESAGLATVIQGEVINRVEGQADKLYRSGEMFPCGPGRPGHAIINTGTQPARLMIGFVLPKGSTVGGPLPSGQQVPVPTPAGSNRNAFITRATIGGIPGEFTLVQLVRDFSPDSTTPQHTYGGPGLMMVIDGEVTVIPRGGEAMLYKPGGFFQTKPGDYALMRNSGSIPARLTSLVVLPKGAELMTALQIPTATATVAPPAATAIPTAATAIPTALPEEPTAIPTVAQEPTAAPLMEMPEHQESVPVDMPRTGVPFLLLLLALPVVLAALIAGIGVAERSRRR